MEHKDDGQIEFEEPEFCKYLYINPDTNTVHLLMPIISGTSIGLDNTCKSAVALQDFFDRRGAKSHTNSAIKALEEYNAHLLKDIHSPNIEGVDIEIYRAKMSRSSQISDYIEILKLISNIYELKMLDGEYPSYPASLSKLIQREDSNLYSMELRPKIQDNMLRGTNRAFSLNRKIDTTGTPSSNFFNAMHSAFKLFPIVPQDKKSQILRKVIESEAGQEFNLSRIQTVLRSAVNEEIQIDIDFTKGVSGEEINEEFLQDILDNGRTIFIKTSAPNDYSSYCDNYVFVEPDQLNYVSKDGRIDYLGVFDIRRFREELDKKRQQKLNITNQNLPDRLKKTIDQITTINLNQEELKLIITDNTGHEPPRVQVTDIVDNLFGYCAPRTFEINEESPFKTIREPNQSQAIEKLSIITQFYLAQINIYCRAQNISTANFGVKLDSSQDLSDRLSMLIINACAQGDNVEDLVIKFINENHETFELNSPITESAAKEISKMFQENFSQIEDSPHFDEFTILDSSHPNLFYQHQGSIVVNFADYILLGIDYIKFESRTYNVQYKAYFQKVSDEQSQLDTIVIPHVNKDINLVGPELGILPIMRRLYAEFPEETKTVVEKLQKDGYLENEYQLSALDFEDLYDELDELDELDEFISQEACGIWFVLNIATNLPADKLSETIEILFKKMSRKDIIEALIVSSPEIIAKLPDEIFNRIPVNMLLENIFKSGSTKEPLLLAQRIPKEKYQEANPQKLLSIFIDQNSELNAIVLEILAEIPEEKFNFKDSFFLDKLSKLPPEIQLIIIQKTSKKIFTQGSLNIIKIAKHLKQLSPETQCLFINKIGVEFCVVNSGSHFFDMLTDLSDEAKILLINNLNASTSNKMDFFGSLRQINDFSPQVMEAYLNNISQIKFAEIPPDVFLKRLALLPANLQVKIIEILPKSKFANIDSTSILFHMGKLSAEAQKLIIPKIPKGKYKGVFELTIIKDISKLSPEIQIIVTNIIIGNKSDKLFQKVSKAQLLEDLSNITEEVQSIIISKIPSARFDNVHQEEVLKYISKLSHESQDILLSKLPQEILNREISKIDFNDYYKLSPKMQSSLNFSNRPLTESINTVNDFLMKISMLTTDN